MTQRIILTAVAFALSSACFAQQPRANVNGRYLLKTAWGGASPFNAFAPDESPLGCHANAFAQVLYFHRLSPHGQVSYRCKNGIEISEDFSHYEPQWDRFALTRDSAGTDTHSIQETSRFMYYVAVIVRKDFGTDQYVDYPNDAHRKAIESHFHCKLSAYTREVESSIEEALRAGTDWYSLMKEEIDAKRPLGFYYTDRKGNGHAVVIDGYTVMDGKTYFHANFGWCGRSDGWYSLAEDLPKHTKEILLITIVPENTKSQGKLNGEKS